MVGGVFFIFTSVGVLYLYDTYFRNSSKFVVSLLFLNFFLSMFLSYKMFTTIIWYIIVTQDTLFSQNIKKRNFVPLFTSLYFVVLYYPSDAITVLISKIFFYNFVTY